MFDCGCIPVLLAFFHVLILMLYLTAKLIYLSWIKLSGSKINVLLFLSVKKDNILSLLLSPHQKLIAANLRLAEEEWCEIHGS